MNPVEPLPAPQRQHRAALLEQAWPAGLIGCRPNDWRCEDGRLEQVRCWMKTRHPRRSDPPPTAPQLYPPQRCWCDRR